MENINEIYEQLDQKFLAFLEANDKQMPSVIYMHYEILFNLIRDNSIKNDVTKPHLNRHFYNQIPILTVRDPAFDFDYYNQAFVQLARAYEVTKLKMPKAVNIEIDEYGETPVAGIEVIEIPLAVLKPREIPSSN